MPTLQDIINFLAAQLAPLGVILANVLITAKETSQFEIRNAVLNIQAAVTNGTSGNAALGADIATLVAQLSATESTLLTAIGTPQQASVAVTLPASPPSGYGSTDPSDVAAAVWSYAATDDGIPTVSKLEAAGHLADNISNNSWLPAQFAPYFLFDGAWNQPLIGVAMSTTPQPLASAILPSDTRLSWLAREVPGIAWIDGYLGSDFVAGEDPSALGFWVLNLNSADFQALKALLYPVGSNNLAPVWPGLSLVTLGTPVALSPGLTITTPMHGVLVSISSVAGNKPFFAFDDVVSYLKIGALTFFSDDGQEEFPQSLGFTSAVYCCRSMARASGVKLRTDPAVTGTITPWLLS